MKLVVSATYTSTQEGSFELPEGVTVGDIESMWMYWNDVHAILKNGESVNLGAAHITSSLSIVDGKRPVRIDVYGTNADDSTDYGNEIYADS